MGTFMWDCERFFGVPVPIEHRNKNPRPEHQKHEEITPKIQARVCALCESNWKVYDAALSRIKRQGSWLVR